jgi:hypothetical protein
VTPQNKTDRLEKYRFKYFDEVAETKEKVLIFGTFVFFKKFSVCKINHPSATNKQTNKRSEKQINSKTIIQKKRCVCLCE